MRVKCVLCDTVENIDSYSLLAKKLRKRRVQTYICPKCSERITEKTNERKQGGNFKLYEEPQRDPHI
ncbi:YlaI family protein [Tenuibacillus multivorans]|uniref:Uncharacterized protein YlaI n=1 Tax=Tenuibacillus multivorans TaxID=237069 RepID=A0A1G9YCF3_9BACI|nr:YlaI family protein [Tenuibacillus multivorans]GEL76021.1 hypothetical protein TMU01_02560 [Tenuibacillus multivorans]SDN06245.1 Uncharacterized protein YlaI [Tenuibacillus multivorans]